MKNTIVNRLSLILFPSGIVSAPLHMVTSTTSTSPTTTGECVAELEYGFQEKLLIIVFMINSNSASKSDLTCFHVVVVVVVVVVISVILQPGPYTTSTSSTSTGENNSRLNVTIQKKAFNDFFYCRTQYFII